MKDAIEFVLVGECKVDLTLAIKRWNLLCRIHKYNNSYTLVEYTPKGKRKLKATISKNDAECIIKELQLQCVQDTFLKNASTYLIVN